MLWIRSNPGPGSSNATNVCSRRFLASRNAGTAALQIIRLADTGIGALHRVLTRADWKRKRAASDSIAAHSASQPELFSIGNEDDLD